MSSPNFIRFVHFGQRGKDCTPQRQRGQQTELVSRSNQNAGEAPDPASSSYYQLCYSEIHFVSDSISICM